MCANYTCLGKSEIVVQEVAPIQGCRAVKNGLVLTVHVLMHMHTILRNLGNPVTSVNYQ